MRISPAFSKTALVLKSLHPTSPVSFTSLHIMPQLIFPPSGESASPAQTRFSSVSTATTETVNSSYSEAEFQPTRRDFDDVDLETGMSKKSDNVQENPQVYTVDPNPLSYVFVSWMTNLMWNGSKKPLTKEDLYNLNPKDSSVHIDSWVLQFWDEYDAFCKQPGKDLPRLWGSMMKHARKFL